MLKEMAKTRNKGEESEEAPRERTTAIRDISCWNSSKDKGCHLAPRGGTDSEWGCDELWTRRKKRDQELDGRSVLQADVRKSRPTKKSSIIRIREGIGARTGNRNLRSLV